MREGEGEGLLPGSCRASPAERMAGAHCATAEATSRQVDTTPTTGVAGRTFSTTCVYTCMYVCIRIQVSIYECVYDFYTYKYKCAQSE